MKFLRWTLCVGLSLMLLQGIMLAVLAKREAGVTQSPPAQETEKITKLKVIDQELGTGPIAKKGSEVKVNYTGTLYPSGEKFDSSLDRGEPIAFKLGSGQVIKGWDKGISGMKVGGKRTLLVPPDMAYGSNGVSPMIPPNATLKFDVELMDVK